MSVDPRTLTILTHSFPTRRSTDLQRQQNGARWHMNDAADTDDSAVPPKLPPETVELRAAPQRVTRLNRRTLTVGIGAVSLAVLGVTLWRSEEHASELQSPMRIAYAVLCLKKKNNKKLTKSK